MFDNSIFLRGQKPSGNDPEEMGAEEGGATTEDGDSKGGK